VNVTNDRRPEGSVPSGVLITTDPEFREQFSSFQSSRRGEFEILLEVDRPFTDIGDEELADIRAAGPDLVIVDLEADPHVGLKFVPSWWSRARPPPSCVPGGTSRPSSSCRPCRRV
jgi:hypothetical protein